MKRREDERESGHSREFDGLAGKYRGDHREYDRRHRPDREGDFMI